MDGVKISPAYEFLLLRTTCLSLEQIHAQTIHLLQILPSGRFVKVHQFGKLCWDDDELVLSEQTHAEELWRSAQVRVISSALVGIISAQNAPSA